MNILKMSAVAVGLLIAVPAIGMAQTAAPSGPAPAAGETSDRTPQAKTETPLSQRDKTTPAPAGATATPPEPGTTSDRTPNETGPGESGTASDDTGAKGKTTTDDDMKTKSPGNY